MQTLSRPGRRRSPRAEVRFIFRKKPERVIAMEMGQENPVDGLGRDAAFRQA